MAQSKKPSTARSRYAEKIPPYNEHMHQVYEFATTRRVVRTGGGPKELTHYQVVMHKQLETALAGNSLAQRDILRQAELAVQSRDLFIQMQCETWTAYKDLLQRGVDHARNTKAQPPSDLPHPADILVDWTKGVTILGPMDEAGRKRCEGLAKFRDALVVQQIMEDADNRVAMDNRPSSGAALVHAFLINTQLPPSFRLADAELNARVGSPAPAGIDPSANTPTGIRHRLPRARGDRPLRDGRPVPAIGAPPCPWG